MILCRLDARTLVASQIEPAHLAGFAADGVTMIVNNRPDGEEAGQPTAAEIEEAARAAGITYRNIPIAGGIAPDQIDAMAVAMADADGQLLAFCRSGTRSTFLWALAAARRGGERDTIVSAAAAAGYDLSPIRHALSGLRPGLAS